MTPSLPNQLQTQQFRFILIAPNSKKPIEEAWTSNNNYSFNDDKLIEHFNKGGNYGVLCGYGNLVVIDFDNKDFMDKFEPLLRETFTVKTGKGGLHKYYIAVNKIPTSHKDKNDLHMFDIQSEGAQVIGPGSIHPNGNKYEVIVDKPIANITLEEIQQIFGEELDQKNRLTFGIRKEETDPLCKVIKESVDIPTLMAEYGYDMGDYTPDKRYNLTMCKLGHDSTGGKCFSFVKEKFHCFHCGAAGNIFHFIMYHEKCSFFDAKNKLATRLGANTRNEFIVDSNVIETSTNMYLMNDFDGIKKVKSTVDDDGEETVTNSYYHKNRILKIESFTNEYLEDNYYKMQLMSSIGAITKIEGFLDKIYRDTKMTIGCLDMQHLPEALSGLINYYFSMGIISKNIDYLINAWGFYVENKEVIKAKNVYENKYIIQNPDPAEVKKALQSVIIILQKYAEGKTVSYNQLLMQYYSTGLVFPFGYCRKQMGLLAPIIIIAGRSGTGKSLVGTLILDTWGVRNISQLTGSSVNSAYQLSSRLSENTFPLEIDEAKQLLEKIEDSREESEILKNAIESTGVIRKRTTQTAFAYRTPFITVNYDVKISSDALSNKIVILDLGAEFTHISDERQAGVLMVNEIRESTKLIGSFIAQKILDRDPDYMKSLLNKDFVRAGIGMFNLMCKELGIDEMANNDFEVGDNAYLKEQNVFEDSIKTFIVNKLINNAKQVKGIIDAQEGMNVKTALDICIKNGNLPNWLIYHRAINSIYITASLSRDMETALKTRFEYGVLENFAKVNKLKYEKKKYVKQSGSVRCYSGIQFEMDEFLDFLNSEVFE